MKKFRKIKLNSGIDTRPQHMALDKKTISKKAKAKKAGAKKVAKKTAAKKASPARAPAKAQIEPQAPSPNETISLSEDKVVSDDQTKVHSIRHFPVTMFAGILGLSGLGLAWRQASVVMGWPSYISEMICWFAAGYAIAIYLLYAIKIMRHPDHMRDDFNHPVRGNFVAAGSMGLMLLASIALPYSTAIAEILWIAGAITTTALTLLIVKNWFIRQSIIKQMTPAWFIPPVGIIVAPIAGYNLGFQDVSWMMMGIGLIFWILLFTIFFNRQLFHPAISESLRPTLFILIAPPALIAIGLTVLEGGYMNGSAKMMYGIALFIALLMLVKIDRFIGIPFGMPWWSFTFPMAALSVASILYHDQDGSFVSGVIAQAILAITTAIVAFVLVRTLGAFASGKLFRAPAG